MIRAVGRAFERGLIEALSAAVRVYQLTLSPLLGPTCRFNPSCSRYLVEAVRKYGLLPGLRKGGRRLIRCHPWHPGGDDFP